MRLSFSEEHRSLCDAFERVFAAGATAERARAVMAGNEGWDKALWRQLADLGWLGATIAEEHGGLGQDVLLQCLLAEAVGRQLAAIPYASAILGFAAALPLCDHPQTTALMPGVVDGNIIGGVVPGDAWEQFLITDGKARGQAPAIADGQALTHLLTQLDGRVILVDLAGAERQPVDALDPLNPATSLRLPGCPAWILAEGQAGAALWQRILAHHAVLLAFAQIGGAETALKMASDHVVQRFAFGRPLGSFQAIKHGLADVLAAIEIARSNAWYAAATLAEGHPDLLMAAASARVSATDAYRQSARANVHYHGGLGVTAESNAHLHYRRAQAQGMTIGSPAQWRETLIQALLARRADLARAAV